MSLGVAWHLRSRARGPGREKATSDSCHCRAQSCGGGGVGGGGSLQARGDLTATYKPTAARACEPSPSFLGPFLYVQGTQTHFSDGSLNLAELERRKRKTSNPGRGDQGKTQALGWIT